MTLGVVESLSVRLTRGKHLTCEGGGGEAFVLPIDHH